MAAINLAGFTADIHHASFTLDQMIEEVVHECELVDHVFIEGVFEGFSALAEVDGIVAISVNDDDVHTSILSVNLFHNFGDLSIVGHIEVAGVCLASVALDAIGQCAANCSDDEILHAHLHTWSVLNGAARARRGEARLEYQIKGGLGQEWDSPW